MFRLFLSKYLRIRLSIKLASIMLNYLIIYGKLKKEIKLDDNKTLDDLRSEIKKLFKIEKFSMEKYSELWKTNIEVVDLPSDLTKTYIEEESVASDLLAQPLLARYASEVFLSIVSYLRHPIKF